MSRLGMFVLGLVLLLGAVQPGAAQAETAEPDGTPTEGAQAEGAETEADDADPTDLGTGPGQDSGPTGTGPMGTDPTETDAAQDGTEATDGSEPPQPEPVLAEAAAAAMAPADVIALIHSVFPGLDGNRAVAIARCESGLRTNVVGGPNSNGTYDWGLFQFNDGGTLQGTLNKLNYPGTKQQQQQWALDGPLNARMALTLRNDRGWGPWWCAWKLGIVAGKWSSTPGPMWNGYDANGFPLPALLEDMSQYVAQAYRDILRRDPDAGGLAGWNDQLRRGLSRDQFAAGMVYSYESSMNHAGDLYREILQRQPDLRGQQGWASEISSRRLSLKDARAVYWASEERFAKSDSSNHEWVSDLYRMELKRNPELDGLNGWVAALDSGALNRTQVAQAFVDCTECATKAVTRAYQEYLGRNPDPAGLASWVAIYPRSDYLILTVHFVASQEYFNRANY